VFLVVFGLSMDCISLKKNNWKLHTCSCKYFWKH